MPPIMGTDTMPRDGGGTENIQKSANMTAVKKKKMQKTAKSIFQFFARLHFLMQIFAHSCNRCEASKE